MKIGVGVIGLMLLAAGPVLSQNASPAPDRQGSPAKRGWMSRMFHPFSSPKAPQYKDTRIRGLDIEIQTSPHPLKLSETRQMEVEGTIPIRDLANQYGIELPDEAGYETLAGFLMFQTGHIPQQGEDVVYGGRKYAILEMERNRITRVRIEPAAAVDVAPNEPRP